MPGEGQHQYVEHPADKGNRPETGQRSGRPGGAAASDAGPLRQALRPRGPIRFEVTETQMADAVCLQIEGELDALTAPKLAAELNMVLRRSDQDVIVDLRKAVFMDSTGLQILVGTQRRLSTASRRLTVMCSEGPIKHVIEVARLGDILNVQAGDDL